MPILDAYPEEAVKTNILGTVNTVNAAVRSGASHFIMVSTDKAVHPISALGASKRIAEKICQAMDEYTPNIKLSTVRFGNVFGSLGSVVPTFLEQIAENNPVTITDPSMDRYFMSVNEATRLVLLAAAAEEGNLFSLDMGDPITIEELAKRLIKYTGGDPSNIKIIGNRGGEKISESLTYPFEHILESKHQKLKALQNTDAIWSREQVGEICAELENAVDSCSRDELLKLLQKYIP